MFDDTIDEEAGDALLEETAAKFGVFLEENPAAADRILEILSRCLEGEKGRRTWADLHERLSNYIGVEPSYLLSWLNYSERSERLGRLASRAPAVVVDLARVVTALYSPEFEAAMVAQDMSADDWRYIWRNADYDHITSTWSLKLRLEKLNGGDVYLEASPNSLATLLVNLQEMIIAVGSAEFFAADRVDALVRTARQMIAMFMPEDDAGAKGNGKHEEGS